jgi:hypothetical protein
LLKPLILCVLSRTYVSALLTPLLLIKSGLFFLLFSKFRLRARTSVLASRNLSQYSEFGLIVVAVSVANGWLTTDWLVVMSLVVAFSFILAAVLIRPGDQLYSGQRDFWQRFQAADLMSDEMPIDISGAHVVIVGMGGVGSGAYDHMNKQHTIHSMPQLWNPTMMVGDEEWSDYTVEVKVRALLKRDMAGVVFRYRTNRHYYLFGLRGGNTAFLTLRLPFEKRYRQAEWKELATVEFEYDSDTYYTLKVENDGARFIASINGKQVLEASDDEILKGKSGVTANIPARFMDFSVTTSDESEAAIQSRIEQREEELERLRADNPRPVLWQKFELGPWGAGRNARFGDLDGDGQIDMLIAQNSRHAYRNSFAHISSLAAFTLDGRLLWSQGRPDDYFLWRALT